jgi:hypothetical protein
MPKLSRQDVLHALKDEWGSYIERFDRFSAEEQAMFLQQQGYQRFADLLGHVIAWWQDGIPYLRRWLADPLQPQPDYDINDFNARAVERFTGSDEDAVRLEFETTRAEMIALVESMPDEALDDAKIARRLYAETIGHYSEHPF